jgi:hypothetical protein
MELAEEEAILEEFGLDSTLTIEGQKPAKPVGDETNATPPQEADSKPKNGSKKSQDELDDEETERLLAMHRSTPSLRINGNH